jgi:hypothetical protein
MYPNAKEKSVLIHQFLSLFTHVVSLYPFRDLNFCCTHETRIIVPIITPSLEHDSTSVWQFLPLDRHVEIGEEISNSNVVAVRGRRVVILLMNRVYSLFVHDNSSISTVIPESMMSIDGTSTTRVVLKL